MWQLNNSHATWTDRDFSASVNVSEPKRGLFAVQLAGRPVDSLDPLQLAIHCDPRADAKQLIERYIRGDDLIATFAESPQADFQPQVYWRMAASPRPPMLACLELIVAVQTRLLDSRPTVQVVSDFGAGHVCQFRLHAEGHLSETLTPLQANPQMAGDDGAPSRFVLFRPDSLDWSYAQMVHPADLSELRMEEVADRPGWSRLRSGLLGHRLEKGVIRLGRLLSVWTSRDSDSAVAAEKFQQFLGADPPLTA